jgi:hypothetical protein
MEKIPVKISRRQARECIRALPPEVLAQALFNERRRETWETHEARRMVVGMIRQNRDRKLQQAKEQPAPRNPFDRLYENWGPANFAAMMEE